MACSEYENTIRNIMNRKGKDKYDKGYANIVWSKDKEKEKECTSSKENTESSETTKENV